MSGKYWESVFLHVHMYLYNIQIVRVDMKTTYKDRKQYKYIKIVE